MRWSIGKVTVTKVVELEATGGSRFLLPQATPEEVREIDWLAPHFADENGRLRLSIHALIIEVPGDKASGGRRILVDTCLGNDKQGRRIPHWNDRHGTFLQDMAEAGFPVESIDTVLCTHLHTDHVGWNTMLVDGQWRPTFPKARYLFGRKEFEHWSNPASGDGAQRAVFGDSVQPIMEAGLAELVEVDHRLCEEVRLVPSHGHTPGHVSVHIASDGEEGFITGDIAHHPCQLARPHWNSTADGDPQAAEAQALINTKVPTYNFDVIQGDLNYTIDLTRAPGEKIVKLEYQGKPVQPQQPFIVATNNYRASGSGSIPGLDGKNIVMSEEVTNRDVVIEWIRKHPQLKRSDIQPSPVSFAPLKLKAPLTFRTRAGQAGVARANGVKGVAELKDNGDGTATYSFSP